MKYGTHNLEARLYKEPYGYKYCTECGLIVFAVAGGFRISAYSISDAKTVDPTKISCNDYIIMSIIK